MNLARILLVALLVSVAGLLLMMSLVDILLGPESSKMADDNDPFGPPDLWWYGFFTVALGVGLLLLAVVLLRPLFTPAGSKESKANSAPDPRSSA